MEHPPAEDLHAEASASGAQAQHASGGGEGIRLYVGQLPKEGVLATEQELRDAFSKYGRIAAKPPIWIAKKPAGFAYIVMETLAEAEAVVAALNDTALFEAHRYGPGEGAHGGRIKVEIAKKNKHDPGARTGGPRPQLVGRGGYEGGEQRREPRYAEEPMRRPVHYAEDLAPRGRPVYYDREDPRLAYREVDPRGAPPPQMMAPPLPSSAGASSGGRYYAEEPLPLRRGEYYEQSAVYPPRRALAAPGGGGVYAEELPPRRAMPVYAEEQLLPPSRRPVAVYEEAPLQHRRAVYVDEGGVPLRQAVRGPVGGGGGGAGGQLVYAEELAPRRYEEALMGAGAGVGGGGGGMGMGMGGGRGRMLVGGPGLYEDVRGGGMQARRERSRSADGRRLAVERDIEPPRDERAHPEY